MVTVLNQESLLTTTTVGVSPLSHRPDVMVHKLHQCRRECSRPLRIQTD
jgi:hypothetical protein